ncbi:hypothetical protein GF376_03985 [Candidatus Peregrinibacteria bacterium]|nr:hypothetical protein [Candidatus Peregrinibacteria bacterium]
MTKILFIFSMGIMLILSGCSAPINEEKPESSATQINNSIQEEPSVTAERITEPEIVQETEFRAYAKDRLAEAIRSSDEVMLADLFCRSHARAKADRARQLLDSWGKEFSARLSTAVETGEFREEEKRTVFEFAHPTSKDELVTWPILEDKKCFFVHNLSLVAADNNAEKYLIDEQVSPNGKHKYELYSTNKNACNAGYLDRGSLVYCTLTIKDVETGEILKKYESNSLGYFKNFSAPQKWYSDSELYIESGFGDACIGYESAIAYNVINDESRSLYTLQAECRPGVLYDIGGKQILLNHEGDDLVIYAVSEHVESVTELYESELSEVPIQAKVELRHRIEGPAYGRITDEHGFSIAQGENSLFYEVETDTLIDL